MKITTRLATLGVILGLLVIVLLGTRTGDTPSALGAPAQQTGPRTAPGGRVIVRDKDVNTFVRIAPEIPAGPTLRAQASTLSITFAAGFDPNAQAAFSFAANIWQSHITSSQPITICAVWRPLPTGVLGSAGPVAVFANFPNLPIANTWYPSALANKLTNSDLDPGTPTCDASTAFGYDIVAEFSSIRGDWYFGTDGNTPQNFIDFATVVLHEIGHGLGFIGAGDVTGGVGSVLFSGLPLIYDRFTFSGGTALTGFPNNSATLAGALTSNNVCFTGPATNSAKLYAPFPFEDGSSYSHLDELTYPPQSGNGLMTPRLERATALHDPGPLTRGILQDMGWTVSGSLPAPTPCGTAGPTPTPAGTPMPMPCIPKPTPGCAGPTPTPIATASPTPTPTAGTPAPTPTPTPLVTPQPQPCFPKPTPGCGGAAPAPTPTPRPPSCLPKPTPGCVN